MNIKKMVDQLIMKGKTNQKTVFFMYLFGFPMYLVLILQLQLANSHQSFIFPLKLTYDRIPLIQMKYICPDLQFDLIIDTGSSQVSLADNSCYQCVKTASICPQIKQSSQKVQYLSTNIEGEFSYLQYCGIRFKVFCIRKSQGYQFSQVHGILGLNGNKTGIEFFKNFFKMFLNMKEISLTFYLGQNQQKLILGQIPHRFVKQKILQVSNQIELTNSEFVKNSNQSNILNKNWKIPVSQIKLQQTIVRQTQLDLYFDSGASVIAFPSQIFNKLFNFIQSKTKQQCFIQQNAIHCSVQFYSIIPNIVFNINKYNCQIQLSKRQFVRINPLNDFEMIFKIVNQSDQNLQNIIIGGIPFFQKYMVSFNLQNNQSLTLYESNREQLIQQEQKNIKMLTTLYIFVLLVAAFLIIKFVQFINVSINKKIII